jgi:hypothetical protein
MNTDYLRVKVMELLSRHRGRANAIPRERVLSEIRCFEPKIDDRGMRKLYSALPVASCDQGLYIPKDARELADFKDYMIRNYGHERAHARVRTIIAYFPALAEDNSRQAGLF